MAACPALRCLSCQRSIVGDVYDDVLARVDAGASLAEALDAAGMPARKGLYECCRARIICQTGIDDRLLHETPLNVAGGDVRLHPEITIVYRRPNRIPHRIPNPRTARTSAASSTV